MPDTVRRDCENCNDETSFYVGDECLVCRYCGAEIWYCDLDVTQ